MKKSFTILLAAFLIAKAYGQSADTLFIKAQSARKSENMTMALNYASQSILQSERSGDIKSKSYLDKLLWLAGFYLENGNSDRAEETYKKAQAVSEKNFGKEHLNTIHILEEYANLLERKGDYNKAEKNYALAHNNRYTVLKASFPFINENEFRECENTFALYHSFAYDHEKDIAASAEHDLSNMIALKELKLRSPFLLERSPELKQDSLFKKDYSRWLDLKKRIAGAYRVNANDSCKVYISQWIQQAEGIERSVLIKSSAFDKMKKDEAFNLRVLEKNLLPNEAMLIFSNFRYYDGTRLTDSVYYIVYVVRGQDSAEVLIPLFDERNLSEMLTNLPTDNGAQLLQAGPSLPVYSKELYDLIWVQIEPYIKGKNTLYIQSSGLINKISFASIHDNDLRFLSGLYKLHYLLCPVDLMRIKSLKPKTFLPQVNLFGNPDFDQAGGSGKATPPIDSTFPGIYKYQASNWNKEAARAREIGSLSSTLLAYHMPFTRDSGEQAMEAVFKHISKGNILHITAPPFEISSESPEYSQPLTGIVVTGGNISWTKNKSISGTEDGLLLANEIAATDLSDKDLIVLSECEYNFGSTPKGEGPELLLEAFRKAGIQSMITACWDIPSPTKQEMFGLFYSNLGMYVGSYYDAFNKAQKTMQHRYEDDPVRWAGFRLIGE